MIPPEENKVQKHHILALVWTLKFSCVQVVHTMVFFQKLVSYTENTPNFCVELRRLALAERAATAMKHTLNCTNTARKNYQG